ncbi:MAG: type II toxin-antitoxin system prevent-host-death family antitoxin [Verrucomicrobia bacterium]|jgi:prevent-host-death family protein|nr:type II toxin-antitoxin system prevent-host-death family antitoxin [Verrucomicrobiota bacterium]
MNATMDVFTIRDLREKTGKLVRDAERGDVSLVTKRGRPAFLTVPLDRLTVDAGVCCSLAVHLLDQRVLTLSQSAKVAGMSIEAFLDVLRDSGVDVVDYPPGELAEEMKVAL